MFSIPFPVTYLLVLHLSQSSLLTIGKLGDKRLEPGFYTYVGSARQHAASRLLRHMRGDAAKKRWHIDYLRAATECVAVNIFDQERIGECQLAKRVSSLAGVTLPIPGFGASDCHCPTHLFFHGDRTPTLTLGEDPVIILDQQEIRALTEK